MRRLLAAAMLILFASLNAIDGICCPDGCTHEEPSNSQPQERQPSDGSEPYMILGLLGEKQFGRIRLFLNGENLTGVRQMRLDPLLLPTRAVDGRWTVDAWAPLEGRNVNGGLRIRF